MKKLKNNLIGLDIETYDPNIKKGLGFINGYVLGLSVCDGSDSFYIPLKHSDVENVPIDRFKSWFREEVAPRDIIGANIMYDLEFLARQFDLRVEGHWFDIQIAEPLLDENRKRYGLNYLAKDYLGLEKEDEELVSWVARELGKRAKPYANIYRVPYPIVEKYAKVDAELPLKIFQIQKEKLEKEGLWKLFMMETKLLRLLLEMRLKGVRVDTAKAEKAKASIESSLILDHQELKNIVGHSVNINASASIAEACDKLKICYPRTVKTNAPSFTQPWMAEQPESIFKQIIKIRKQEKLKNTFLNGSILNYVNSDKIHTQFHPLRSSDHGAVSGRLSSSNPNLMFIPSPSKGDGETGQLIRSIFVPEEGCDWYKFDYSSIEPRVALHYADESPIVLSLREHLRQNPAADFYQPMMDMMPSLPRSLIKSVYLGIGYAMGKTRLAEQLDLSQTATETLLRMFHQSVPYLKTLSAQAQMQADQHGYVRTLMGRKRRFNLWQNKEDYFSRAFHREEALLNYKTIRRAYTYKAFNAVIQGSAADIMKKAMVDLFDAGLPIMHLTLHDECDFSLPKGPKGLEMAKEIKRIMENCVKLQVQMNVDMEVGPSWGEVK